MRIGLIDVAVAAILWTLEGVFGVYVWHPFDLGGVLEDAAWQDNKTDDGIRCAEIAVHVKMLMCRWCLRAFQGRKRLKMA